MADWLAGGKEDGEVQANLNMDAGVGAQPDRMAQAVALGRRFSVPVPVAEQNLDDYTRKAAAEDARATILNYPKLIKWTAAKPQNAAVAHDDVGVLGKIEGWFDGFSAGGLGRSAAAGLSDVATGALGAARGVTAAVDKAVTYTNVFGLAYRFGTGKTLLSGADAGLDAGARATEASATRTAGEQPAGVVASGLYSGARSLATSMAALETGLVNPLAGLGVAGAVTGGMSYQKGKEAGLGDFAAGRYAATDAAIEVATERLPFLKFLEDTKVGTPVLKRFVSNLIGENIGEQFATLGQDFNQWASIDANNGKTFGQFLDERPAAALQTALATTGSVGAINAGTTALEVATRRGARAERQATQAEAHAQQLKELLATAGASALRERDPVTFHDFMEAQTEDGPLEHVYVDGKTLNQELTAAGEDGATFAAASPAIREQLAQAVETGGDVRIPVAELATLLPGSTLEQKLVDHLRTDPLVPSAAEAREQAGGTLESVQAGFEAQLGEQQQNDDFQASREAVTQHFVEQLNTANRFTTDVNAKYAGLLGSFYAVQAAKLGITPEAMLQRYPLQVRSVDENAKGNRLGQFVGTNALRLPNNGYETLKLAGERLRAGENPEVVRKETGWSVGDDERLRYEISDKEAKFKSRAFDYLANNKRGLPLQDVIQHDALFAAYPQLRSVQVRVDQSKAGRGASFAGRSQGSSITLNAGLMQEKAGRVKSTLLHEIQHAIQYVEGFTSGASPNEDHLRELGFGDQLDATIAKFQEEGDGWTVGGLEEPEARRAALFDVYTKVAGEIEARNTQNRSDLTDEQRREISPDKTRDVPREESLLYQSVLPVGERLQGNRLGQVGSPEFNAWFGGSKAVDKQGNPVVVLHGTAGEITAFDPAKRGAFTGAKSAEGAFWFASRENTAKFYANGAAREANAWKMRKEDKLQPNIIKAYLSLKNPLVVDMKNKVYRETSFAETVEKAKREGHDGVIIKRAHDAGEYSKLDALLRGRFTGETLYAVFDPTQIKSATDNAGSYDPNDPNILRQSALPEGERLRGLPYRIKVDGETREFGPFHPARDAAEAYAKQAGIPYLPPRDYVKVDEERAKRIAQAFEDMKHAPDDPMVKAAYDAMIAETLAQWQAIKATGLKVEFITGDDPYGNPRNAILDVVENNHLWVFPTSDGFGGSESADVDISGNPLLATVEGEEISGRPVQANDIFRIVHDYFGHIKEGVGFRADGEENAWRSHAAMYSPLARMAMTTETRGQNSWVNFGPHAEANKTANPADTQYAPQKIGLLPMWVIGDAAIEPASLARAPTVVADAEGIPLTVYHGTPYSFTDFKSATGKAVWFAEGAGLANTYADPKRVGARSGGQVFPAHVYATNPIRLGDVQGTVEDSVAWGKEHGLDLPAFGWGRTGSDTIHTIVRSAAFAAAARAAGYDAIEQTEGNTNTWGVLYPSSVLSATDPEAVLFQKTRGYITFGQDITAQTSTITLLNASDLSTFLHESGHFFLEVMAHMSAQPGAPQSVTDDMKTALDWMGVKPAIVGQWISMTLEQKREYHEKFARGFEAYLFEGKAPSVDMRGVFQRFRAWIVSVYRNNIANLKAPLDDEIRGVFDRMIASTEAITAAEGEAQVGPVFTEQPAGMTDTEWEEYQALGISATAEAIDELQTKSLRDMRFAKRAHARELKRLKADIAAQRELVEDEVRGEIGSQPVYRAIQFLKRGTLDGAQIEGVHKLSLAEVKAAYQLATTEFLREKFGYGKYGMLAEDGIHPAQVAELFGFTSASELLSSIVAAPNMETEIDAAVEQRMLERFGDINSPEALDAAASAAIHNEVRARFVATELGALDKGVGKPRVLAKAARQYAENIIARLKVRDVRPAQYEAAERRAAAAAHKAVKANDIATATAEKRNQLVNLYATKAAREAQDEVRKAIDYFRKFARVGTRTKIDGDYLDQIDGMLDRFELRTGVSDKQLAKRKTLAEWIDRQRELGFEPAIDPDLENEARRQSYRDLTMDELRGLRDSIANIEHLGRLKHKLLKNKEQREFGAAVEAGAAEIRDNAYKVKRLPVGARTWLERAASGVDEFFAIHRKFASLIREMSAGKDGGVLWGLFTRPMNDAGDHEAVMTADATEKLHEIFKRIRGDNTFVRVYEPAIDASISLETRLMVALNWGNETNRRRVMDGDGWTLDQVNAVLAPLTEEHWQFVKDVWAHVNSYWPEIAAKEKRVTGVEPEKVEAEAFAFTTGEGKTIALPGGYFPIKYDPDKSSKADADTAAEVQRQITQGLYTRATTRRGHTKARVDKVERSIRKDFSVIFQHNSEVIHDLAWHETLIDLNRLLKAGQIDEAIREHYGPAVIRVMRKTLEDIAVGGIPAQNVLERGVNYLRAGATVAGLGWNLMTSLFQPLGLTNSVVRIGPKYVARGISRVFRDAASMNATTSWVYAQSDFMKLRAQTQQREIAEIRQQFQARGPIRGTLDRIPGVAPTLDVVGGSFFLLITKAQLIADIPTWAGGYEKAIDAGETHERAVALADQGVIDSQGGGQIKDLAGVQRGGPFQKLWTNFYSWFNVAYNQLAESVNETRRIGPERLPLMAVDFLLIAVVPALLTSLLRGVTGGDDPDDLKKRILNDQLSGYLGFMFGMRELGAMFGVGSSYSGPAGARAIDASIKLGKQVQQGEADEAFWKAANNAAGVLFHYPAGQVQRTYTGITALADGKTRNPLVILTGAPRKQ